MKFIVTLKTEGDEANIEMPSVEVDIPENYADIILKGANIATIIARGIESIKETLDDRD